MNGQNQQQTPSTQLRLPGIDDLLKRAFSVYKARLGTFLGIMIFPVISNLFLLIFPAILKDNLALDIFLFIVFGLAAVIIVFWSYVSLIFAIRDREEKTGIMESFRRGWSKMISSVWILFLIGIITIGGCILFIIPGIIFFVWFVFSVYVLVSEDLRGMNALFRSKQLVAGYWWEVLCRFLAMYIVLFVPIILVYAILAVGTSAAFVGSVVEIIYFLFVTPFIFVFEFLFYEDLKRQKVQTLFEPPKKGTKIKFILIGIAGLLLIPAILFLVLLSE